MKDALLLRMKEVSDLLSVSRSMAYKLVSTGQLPVFRLGKSVRVRKADLDRFVGMQQRQDPSDGDSSEGLRPPWPQ